jgi:hypothetical protein
MRRRCCKILSVPEDEDLVDGLTLQQPQQQEQQNFFPA